MFQISDDHHCQDSVVPVPSKCTADQNWSCYLCEQTCKSIGGLKRHIRRFHWSMNANQQYTKDDLLTAIDNFKAGK